MPPDPAQSDPTHSDPAPDRPRGWRRARKPLIGLLVCLLLLGAVALGGALWLHAKVDGSIQRLPDPFAELADRPAKPTSGSAADAMNILVLGTDTRSDTPTTGAEAPGWKPGQARSDTMLLVHLDGDRRGASVISIPRDAWVDIPGHGKGKVSWAYSFGGPSLTIETVEKMTDVRVDHVAVVDWDGFRALTDAIGGVDIEIPKTVYDSARGVRWEAGRHHLDGDEALLYVRQRYGLRDGDLDRVARQQAFLRTLLEQTLEQELRKDPARVLDLLTLFGEHASVDDDWSTTQMARLAASLRNLRTGDISYLTVPTDGTGMVGDQSVVRLDPSRDRSLWRAVREDRMPQWAADNQDLLTPDVVR
ncbi:LCP family protein required for cell wall assembly [Nocardioides luteus]|uniref:LCP family protein n=2 Tax=Nocardioides luteus TaxID=1844 RepID=UPI00166380B5|nr:LCP family protein [Nocardioides luteus]MDR7309222.1 LCP family protein required for cell wall assembly [Nocardioides luteus]